MNTELIKELLNDKSTELFYFEKVISTNITAKEKAPLAARNAVIFAIEQSGGRGRFERGFYSPPHTGIYMSVILKDVLSGAGSALLTPAAAVAVCRAVKSLTGKNPQIKWVNDVMLEGGKICGILTEAVYKDAVVGIGINFTTDFTELPELNAASVFASGEIPSCSREQLAAAVINQLLDLCGKSDFMDEYRELCCLTGREVSYMLNNEKRFGTVTGVDDLGRLLIRDEAGETTALSTGEVMLVREV